MIVRPTYAKTPIQKDALAIILLHLSVLILSSSIILVISKLVFSSKFVLNAINN